MQLSIRQIKGSQLWKLLVLQYDLKFLFKELVCSLPLSWINNSLFSPGSFSSIYRQTLVFTIKQTKSNLKPFPPPVTAGLSSIPFQREAYSCYLHIPAPPPFTLFFFFTSLLEYNCFTVVCQFLLYNKVNQLYIYIYLHISSLLHLPPSSHSLLF